MSQQPPQPPARQAGDGDLGARLLGLVRAAQRRGPEDRAFREAAAGFRAALGTLEAGRWRLRARSTSLGYSGGRAGSADAVLLERLERHGLRGLEIAWEVSPEDLHRLALALARADRSGAAPAPFPEGLRGVKGVTADELAPWFQESGPADEAPPEEGEGDDMHRSLDEVLDVGVNVLERAIGGLGGGGLDIDALEGALGAAEHAIASSGEQVSKPVVPVGDVPPPDDPEFREYRLGREALMGEVEAMLACGVQAQPVTLVGETEVEELSILLHTLLEAGGSRASTLLLQRLHRRLRADMPAEARDLVWGAVRDLAERGQEATLDGLLPIFARVQRFSAPPFAAQLASMVGVVSPVGQAALWPYAANELLVTRRDRGERTPRALVDLVASIHPDHLPEGIPRLRRLDALTHERLSSDPFQARARRLYPLFSRLLATPDGEKLGPAVLRGLRVMPPSVEWKAVIDALWGYRESYAPLLSGVLAFADGLRMPEGLRALAVRVVAEALGDLDRGVRDEDWVLAAVEWMAGAGSPEAYGFLLRVTRERRRWLLRAWPAPVRRAARAGLAALKAAGYRP